MLHVSKESDVSCSNSLDCAVGRIISNRYCMLHVHAALGKLDMSPGLAGRGADTLAVHERAKLGLR